MNKLLSIIVPTYNMEELLPRCIDSLISPRCDERLEIFIINDGSKDKSSQIAKSYETRYPGIVKAIDKENGNYGSVINKGIEIASGKYFRILDADDFYENKGLVSLLDKLEYIDTDLILTDYRRDRMGNSKLFCASKDEYNKVQSFDQINIDKFPNYVMHGITIKTSILRDNNIQLQHGISYTDVEFCFYPIPFIKTFIALDILVYCYQIGREGQTVELSSQIKSVSHMEKIAHRMYRYLQNHSFPDPVYYKLRKFYCDINSLCLMTILCFTKSNQNLIEAQELVDEIKDITGAHEIMINKNLYGVKYYKRYSNSKIFSNGPFHRHYYKLIRNTMKFCLLIRNILK